MIGRNQIRLQYKEDYIEIEVICVFCNNAQPKFDVSQRNWESYSSGRLSAKEAFPYLPLNERELLISAVCSDCWDTLE